MQVTPDKAMLGDVVVFEALGGVEKGHVRKQDLWPVHCEQGTYGAALHQNLKVKIYNLVK